MALALATVAGGALLARRVPVDFVIEEDRSEFNVWLKMPLGSAVSRTEQTVTTVEDALRGMREVVATFSTIGAGAQKRVNEALIYVQLVHKSEREASQAEMMSRVRAHVRDLGLPLADMAVEEIPFLNIVGGRNAEIMYSIRGPEMERLEAYAEALVERLRGAPGFGDLYESYETGRPEVSLEITRERAGDLGVPALAIGRTIAALYAGYRATTFEDRGERYDVRVQVRPEFRDDVDELDLVRVRAPGGALVPLRNLVTARIGSGPVEIDRENRSRAITVYGNLEGDTAAGTADAEVMAAAAQLGISGEYQIEPVGPSKRLHETIEAVGFAFGLALVAIYMILAAQFNSFAHPFTIMLSAPLSFIGAFAAVWLAGYPLDVMGQIAFLLLMGIVMKNGILLVDYTNTLRARGHGLREALLEAGPARMRPVLMTTVATVAGMLPVAFGKGDGSEWRNPMGLVAIGGLLTSTLLTLLVVPVAYTLVDDAERGLRRARARLRGGVAAPRRAPSD
jgi:HAE1 family hydrophobic/amphiphilic exporter-1